MGLDVPDELVRAAGDDEVEMLVEGEELGDDVARRDQLDCRIRDQGLLQRCRDDGRDGDEGFGRLLAALEDRCVARLDGQRGNVGDDLRASLEDDKQNTNGAGYPLELEAVV